ncbi:MAG: hypothetical protein P8Y74_10920, partial [Desulfobacterales bacterium]
TAGFRVGHHFLEIIYLPVVEFCPHNHPRTGFKLGEFNRLEIKKSGTGTIDHHDQVVTHLFTS